MKSLILLLGLSFVASTGYAKDAELRNCFSPAGRAQFFAHKMKALGENNETPVMLLNQKMEVTGIITVKVIKDTRGSMLKSVRVTGMELCSGMTVDEWYYADNSAEDLRNWTKADDVEVHQDEGVIYIDAEVIETMSYADLVRVNFRAWDYEEENNTGTFYFYMPRGWK